MDPKYFIAHISYCFFILSCASIKAPSGGPKDETPPKLVQVIPSIGSVNFNGGRVELIFSEYLNERSISKGVSILPKFDNDPEIIFKGEKILIEFPKNLLQNQTYVISINRKLLDEHGVSFSESIQAAFSTGSEIDRGSISGTIYGKKLRSVLLWKVDGYTDSSSYFLNNPNYVMDVSDEGLYSFNYLSNGVYKIVAVNEKSFGLPLDSEFTLAGLPWQQYLNINNDIPNIMDINIIIPKKSGQNKMLRAEWSTSHWIKIFFLNNLDNLLSNDPVKFFNDNIEIYPKKIFKDRLDNSILHIILEDSITDIKSMIIKAEHIFHYENTLLDSGQILVNFNSQNDSTNLKIEFPDQGYTHYIRNDSIMPFYIDFSKIINQEKTIPIIKLFKDSLLVPINLEWSSPLSLVVTPKKNWDQNQNYTLNIFSESINPVFGNTFADSIPSINFKTSKPMRFGRIIGRLKSKFLKNLVLNLKDMGKGQFKDFYSNVDENGNFSFDLIPQGDYELKIFDDIDKNMRYSYGNIALGKSSEWFSYYPDTLKVRGNWDLELGDIEVDLPF